MDRQDEATLNHGRLLSFSEGRDHQAKVVGRVDFVEVKVVRLGRVEKNLGPVLLEDSGFRHITISSTQ